MTSQSVKPNDDFSAPVRVRKMGTAYRCGDCAAGINTRKVGQDLAFTGTAVWAVREDGKLTENGWPTGWNVRRGSCIGGSRPRDLRHRRVSSNQRRLMC